MFLIGSPAKLPGAWLGLGLQEAQCVLPTVKVSAAEITHGTLSTHAFWAWIPLVRNYIRSHGFETRNGFPPTSLPLSLPPVRLIIGCTSVHFRKCCLLKEVNTSGFFIPGHVLSSQVFYFQDRRLAPSSPSVSLSSCNGWGSSGGDIIQA